MHKTNDYWEAEEFIQSAYGRVFQLRADNVAGTEKLYVILDATDPLYARASREQVYAHLLNAVISAKGTDWMGTYSINEIGREWEFSDNVYVETL